MEYDDPVSWNDESFIRYHYVYHLTYIILDIITRREVSLCYKDSTSISMNFNVVETILDLVSLECLFYNLPKPLHYIQILLCTFSTFVIFFEKLQI